MSTLKPEHKAFLNELAELRDKYRACLYGDDGNIIITIDGETIFNGEICSHGDDDLTEAVK